MSDWEGNGFGCSMGVQVTAESTAHLLEQVGRADTSKVARRPSEGQFVVLENLTFDSDVRDFMDFVGQSVVCTVFQNFARLFCSYARNHK